MRARAGSLAAGTGEADDESSGRGIVAGVGAGGGTIEVQWRRRARLGDWLGDSNPAYVAGVVVGEPSALVAKHAQDPGALGAAELVTSAVAAAVAIDEFSVIGNNGDRQDAISGVNFGAFTVYEAIVSAAGSTLVVGVDAGESAGQPHPLAAQDPENFSGLTISDTNPFLHAIIVERVPEPTTAVVLLTGLACCGLAMRRR